MKKPILVIVFLIVFSSLNAQIVIENRTVKLREIFEQAVFKDTTFVYKNCAITIDDLKESLIGLGLSGRIDGSLHYYKTLDRSTLLHNYQLDSILVSNIRFDSLDRVVINSDLEIIDCTLLYDKSVEYTFPLISGFVFRGLNITNLNSPHLSFGFSKFIDCTRIEGPFDFLSINGSEFLGGLKLVLTKENSALHLSNLDIKQKWVKSNHIFYGPVSAAQRDSRCEGLTIRSEKKQNLIQISRSNIAFNDYNFSLSVPTIDNLLIHNDTVSCPISFKDLIIENRFQVLNSDFKSTISLNNFIFSDRINDFDWSTFQGRKIVSLVDSDSILARDPYAFRTLMREYKTLHEIFLKNGDIQSANGCYVEMKELETMHLQAVWDDNGGYYNFLKLSLNHLIKYYANYGTDPILAIKISTFVLLLFSMFYFFFPSEWDSFSKKELTKHSGNSKQTKLKKISIHYLNSFALSINSFVTLGFGAIPTTGLPRYLCILEGFIGWFLLSIFTVSLLSQLML